MLYHGYNSAQSTGKVTDVNLSGGFSDKDVGDCANGLKTETGPDPNAFWIRLAGTDDLAAMTRLLQELFSVETEFEVDAEKQRCGLQMLLELPSAAVWVAERRGRVVGMVTMQLTVSSAEGGLSGLLEDMVISPACRRRGLGRALLNTAVNWARAQGAVRVQLLADGRNVPALIFYRKQGWKQTNMIALRSFC
jgi:GNAT superfamily N-acetyltransferase